MAIATVSPVTGEILKSFDELTPEELEDKLARAAVAAAESYRLTSVEQRAGWLGQAADNLKKEADSVSKLITAEIGKTYQAAQEEVTKCMRGLRFYAAEGPGFLRNLPSDARSVGAKQTYVTYQPIGVVLAVMPWNLPLWQAMRFAAPALTAGNVGILKHASNVPQTALYLEQLFRDAGFPDDVFQTLLISAERVEQVLRDDRVQAATLTGSEPAGRSVATIAGNEIKKVILELGGSDPFIVTPSTNLVRLANGHPYGLGSNLWSEDPADRELFIRDVQSGMAFISGNTTSYPEIPFGGVKLSGYGRELSDLGMREFMNAKTVWIGENAGA